MTIVYKFRLVLDVKMEVHHRYYSLKCTCMTGVQPLSIAKFNNDHYKLTLYCIYK